MITRCPHCSGYNEMDPQYVGRTVRCGSCGGEYQAVNPNLFPCPDCYSLISRRASVCPRCGAPVKGTAGNVNTDDIASEKSIAVYHPSAMNFLWEIIVGIILIPVALIGVLILIYVCIEIYCTCYELTTHRVIVRKGWIAKRQNEIWIKDMRGVNFNQTIWQRIIGTGDIAIGTAASAGTEISIVGIAKPAQVVDEINALRRS